MSLKTKSIQSIFWSSIQQFGSQGVTFVVSILLARLLTPAEFGLVAMLLVLIQICEAILDSGLSQSLIRSSNVNNEDYATVFYYNLGSSIILYFLLYVSSGLIASFYNEPQLTVLLQVLGLVIVIKAFSVIQITKLTKSLNFKTQTIIALPALVGSAVIALYMAFNNYGVWSLVAYRLSREFFSSILLWFHIQWYPGLVFSLSKFRVHFRFGLNLLLSSLLNSVFNNIYTLVIGKYFSASLLGYFNRADSLQKLPVHNLGSILNRVTYPLFSEIKEDNIKLKSTYLKVIGLSLFIMSPVMIFMGVLAKPLILFLLTDKWIEVVPYLQILAISGLLFPIHSFNLNILKVKGRSDLFLKLEIIKKVIIVLSVAVAINFGVIGLVWSIVFTSLVALFINTYYSGKMIGLTVGIQLKQIYPSIILGMTCGLIVLATSSYLYQCSNSHMLNLIVSTLIGSTLYLTISYLSRSNDYIELKKLLIKK